MQRDPDKHHRRSIRLQGYDYSQGGAYFVTICARNRECLFDDTVLRRYPPFALLLLLNAPYDASSTRISHFANYRYNDPSDVSIDLFVGEGHTPFPKDFRSKKEVEDESGMPLREE